MGIGLMRSCRAVDHIILALRKKAQSVCMGCQCGIDGIRSNSWIIDTWFCLASASASKRSSIEMLWWFWWLVIWRTLGEHKLLYISKIGFQ